MHNHWFINANFSIKKIINPAPLKRILRKRKNHAIIRISNSNWQKSSKEKCAVRPFESLWKEFCSHRTFTRLYWIVTPKLSSLFAVWHFFQCTKHFLLCVFQYVCSSTTPLRHLLYLTPIVLPAWATTCDWFENFRQLLIGQYLDNTINL